jgi:hypothetical protein
MQAEQHDWSVPAPLRALLWWPPVAFLVALLDPGAAAGTIAVVGAALAVLGVLGATVGSVITRRTARRRPEPVAPALPQLAMVGVESVTPAAAEQRAA